MIVNKFDPEFLKTIEDIEEKYSGVIYKIYEIESLRCLSIKETLIKGVSPITYFSNMTAGFKPIRDNSSIFGLETELTNCTKDIKFHLGQLILYHHLLPPTIFNERFNGVFDYFPNREINRYLQNASTLFEKCYNFWDTIGDVLDSFIETDMKINKVSFVSVIDTIHTRYPNLASNSADFNWLSTFKSTNYTELNNKRKNVVHYFNIETYITTNWAKLNCDKIEIKKLELELFSFTDYFKEELENCLTGFEKALSFINEYYNKLNQESI